MKKEENEDIDSPKIQELKKAALEKSIKEGSATAFSSGTTLSYATPYALALGATGSQIGFLSASPAILNPLAQFASSKLMEKYHRKEIVKLSVLLQAITFLPLGVIGLLSYFNIISNYLVYLFIAFYALLSIFGGMVYPPWFSWMGDLTNEKERGEYFARRNRILGIVEILGMLTGLLLLNTFKTIPVLIGFSTLFFLAFISRLYSLYLIRKQYIPLEIKRKRDKIFLKQFLNSNKNFKIFSTYNFFLNFAIFIASPFFAVYMLDKSSGLSLSYTWFIIITTFGAIFNLIFLKIIGKFSDKHGNLKLITVSNLFFALNPLLWILIKNPFGLIFIQLVSGLANASFIISFNNFSYNSLEQKSRGIGIAYVSILLGIGAFLGSLVGGFIIDYVPINFINKFFFLFIIAAILRLAVAVVFIPSLSESQKSNRNHHINLAHPFRGLYNELTTLNYFIHYIEKEESQSLKVLKPLKKNVLRK